MDRANTEFSDYIVNEEVPSLPRSQRPSRPRSCMANSSVYERENGQRSRRSSMANPRAYERENGQRTKRADGYNNDEGHNRDIYTNANSYGWNNGHEHNGYSRSHEDHLENQAGSKQPTIHQPRPMDMSSLHHLIPLLQKSQKKEKKPFTERLKKALVDFVSEPALPELPPSPPPAMAGRHEIFMRARARVAQSHAKVGGHHDTVPMPFYYATGLDPA